jgi:tetratricopeptide (TPR) repeat protein
MKEGLLACLVCVLAVVATAGQASAQEDREEEARALFMAGRAAYDAGRYEAALSRFQEAYDLSGRPALLYNVGQTADRLRQDQVALDAFERFLAEAADDAPNRDVAQRRVAFLRRSIGPEPDPDPEPDTQAADPDPESDDGPDLDPAAMDADDLGVEDDEPDPALPPAEDEGAESGGSLWWVGVIAGVVVVGAVIGLAVALSGGDEDPQYAESDLGRTVFALGEW